MRGRARPDLPSGAPARAKRKPRRARLRCGAGLGPTSHLSLARGGEEDLCECRVSVPIKLIRICHYPHGCLMGW